MTLFFPDGQHFVTGSTPYDYRAATEKEVEPRLIIQVGIENILTEAVVDTGGVYLLCNPNIAAQLNLDETGAISDVKTLVMGRGTVKGRLHRLCLTLFADKGHNLEIEATAFIPEPDENMGELPCFLGLYGCLERLRFAVDTDPHNENFYFGPIP